MHFKGSQSEGFFLKIETVTRRLHVGVTDYGELNRDLKLAMILELSSLHDSSKKVP